MANYNKGSTKPPIDKYNALPKDSQSDTPPEPKIYSAKFSGEYTQHQLDYLESYYEGLVKERGLEDVNSLDYAKKAAKASLQANEMQALYAAGKCSLSSVKEALSMFDLLSKSANFAPSKKDARSLAASDMSVGEMVLELIESDHFCNEPVEWPKDDVDKTVDMFLHLVEAMHPVDN